MQMRGDVGRVRADPSWGNAFPHDAQEGGATACPSTRPANARMRDRLPSWGNAFLHEGVSGRTRSPSPTLRCQPVRHASRSRSRSPLHTVHSQTSGLYLAALRSVSFLALRRAPDRDFEGGLAVWEEKAHVGASQSGKAPLAHVPFRVGSENPSWNRDQALCEAPPWAFPSHTVSPLRHRDQALRRAPPWAFH